MYYYCCSAIKQLPILSCFFVVLLTIVGTAPASVAMQNSRWETADLSYLQSNHYFDL